MRQAPRRKDPTGARGLTVPSFTQFCSLPTATTPACATLINDARTAATVNAGAVDEHGMAGQLTRGMSEWRSCPESQRCCGASIGVSGAIQGVLNHKAEGRKAARLSPRVARSLLRQRAVLPAVAAAAAAAKAGAHSCHPGKNGSLHCTALCLRFRKQPAIAPAAAHPDANVPCQRGWLHVAGGLAGASPRCILPHCTWQCCPRCQVPADRVQAWGAAWSGQRISQCCMGTLPTCNAETAAAPPVLNSAAHRMHCSSPNCSLSRALH